MNRTAHVWIACGAILAGFSVILAALGDHVLKFHSGPAEVRLFELAVRYQFYHAFALILCGLLSLPGIYRGLNLVAMGFLLGICGFSGGLFLKVVWPTMPVGPIIPAGAILWTICWFALAVCVFFGRGGDRIRGGRSERNIGAVGRDSANCHIGDDFPEAENHLG